MNFTCIIFYSLIYITNIYSSILNDKSLLVEYSVPQDCIYQPLGLMNHKHFSDINTTMFLIGNIVPLSCICSTEINEIGRYYEEEFLGIRGAMINNDCGALRFFVRVRIYIIYLILCIYSIYTLYNLYESYNLYHCSIQIVCYKDMETNAYK